MFYLALLGTAVYLVRFLIYRKKDKKSEKTAKEKKYAIMFAVAMIICLIGYGSTAEDNADNSTSTSSNVSSKESSSSEKSSEESSETSSSDSTDTTSKIDKQYNDETATQNSSNYSYGELVKSSKHAGESFKLTNATVLQAQEDDETTYLLVYINNDSNELYSVNLNGTTPAVEDDIVTVQGLLGQLDNYDTKSGGSNTVPSITASKVDVTGHSNDAE